MPHILGFIWVKPRKTSTSESRRNTQLSARVTDAEVSGAKVENFNAIAKRSEGTNNHNRFLNDGGGRVYSWVAGGKVYLNRDAMNPETPLHEYTNLWDEMVRKENPELWACGKELMKQTPMWDEVVNDPNYADIADDEDAISSWVLL